MHRYTFQIGEVFSFRIFRLWGEILSFKYIQETGNLNKFSPVGDGGTVFPSVKHRIFEIQVLHILFYFIAELREREYAR